MLSDFKATSPRRLVPPLVLAGTALILSIAAFTPLAAQQGIPVEPVSAPAPADFEIAHARYLQGEYDESRKGKFEKLVKEGKERNPLSASEQVWLRNANPSPSANT